MSRVTSHPEITINKTIMTSRLSEGIWERWIAHGIDGDVIEEGKNQLFEINDWIDWFKQYAYSYEKKGIMAETNNQLLEAEHNYRKSGLYYNIMQWIYPDRCKEKIHFYEQSIDLFKKADELSEVHTKIVKLSIENQYYVGRIRIPTYYKGCMIILNPIDSTKEELYSYEKHFLDSGFITISFDGPGQGESFILNNIKLTNKRMELFVDEIINYAHTNFPHVAISLFGTSSGAAWAINGSKNPFVSKSVAISPPIVDKTTLPDYFKERLAYITDGQTTILPNLHDVSSCKSVILFHGNKDVMINDDDMYKLFLRLPEPKHLVEYAEEGHCCNNKLYEVRDISMKWFYTKESKELDVRTGS